MSTVVSQEVCQAQEMQGIVPRRRGVWKRRGKRLLCIVGKALLWCVVGILVWAVLRLVWRVVKLGMWGGGVIALARALAYMVGP